MIMKTIRTNVGTTPFETFINNNPLFWKYVNKNVSLNESKLGFSGFDKLNPATLGTTSVKKMQFTNARIK